MLREGAPWFVAKDVCNALSLPKVTDAIKNLDANEGRKPPFGPGTWM